MRKKRRSAEFKNNSQVIDIAEARQQRQARRQAEKDREEEKRRYAASQKTRGKMAIRRSRNRRRLVIALVALFITGIIAASLINVVTLKAEQREVMKEAEALQQEKERLEKELSQIRDPENIEQEARDQLRLIKPGEKLYMFPEDMGEQTVPEEDGDAAGEAEQEE